MPSVVNNPPKRWNKYLNNKTKEEIKNLLVEELNEKFGLSDDILEQMKVSLLYKGVTYESLNDPKFVATAKKAIPSLKVLFEEFDAAKASK